MASPLYTYVSSDNVLQPRTGEQDLSNSASPAVMDFYTPNINSNESYVPWFIDTDNIDSNFISEPEPRSGFTTSLEDAEWDYQQSPMFPPNDTTYYNTTGNVEPWSNTLPQQYIMVSPENTSGLMEGGEYASSYLASSQQQSLEISANHTLKQEIQTPPENKPPSHKRRKSSTTSTSSPTEDYRKGHNAIEKRYRSNLNSKILSLEQCLPVQETPEDENDAEPARKTKSAILTRAVKHIEFLKQTTRRLTQETEDLNRKFSALEKIAMRGTVVEVMEVDADGDAEADIEDQEETTVVELEEHLSPETDIEAAILNSKLLTRRRLRRGDF